MSRLIDTKEFIKRIDHYPQYIRDTAKKELRYCKTVDAVPVVHARWVFSENDDMFYCTNCKNGSVRNDYPYCHWCGAKMDATDINVGNKEVSES